ncbi:MAG: DUF3545 family protein [Colwellia sp.]|nr:DUF3545 family protein [Colwellia sp.]
MQNDNWLDCDLDFDELEEPHEKKKSKKMYKRKWREIESFKDKQRERKVMDINDHYYSM